MSINVQELDLLFNKLYEYRELKKKFDEEEKALNKTIDELENSILIRLKENNKDKWDTENATFYISRKMSVTVPKEPEKKETFMNYLEGNGLKSMFTVHSATLNSWYNQEAEKGNTNIPGLDMPTLRETLNMRRK